MDAITDPRRTDISVGSAEITNDSVNGTEVIDGTLSALPIAPATR